MLGLHCYRSFSLVVVWGASHWDGFSRWGAQALGLVSSVVVSPGQNTGMGSRSPSPRDLPNPGMEPKKTEYQTEITELKNTIAELKNSTTN